MDSTTTTLNSTPSDVPTSQTITPGVGSTTLWLLILVCVQVFIHLMGFLTYLYLRRRLIGNVKLDDSESPFYQPMTKSPLNSVASSTMSLHPPLPSPPPPRTVSINRFSKAPSIPIQSNYSGTPRFASIYSSGNAQTPT
jgi:hypothetical protein